MNIKFECKSHEIYFKMLRKICNKANLNLVRVLKNLSFDQTVVYVLVSRYIFSTCSALTVPALFEHFGFLLSFFSISSPNNNFLFLFPVIGGKCCSVFEVITYKPWDYYWLYTCKPTGMVYHNQTSLMISANDARCPQLLLIFPPSRKTFHIAMINHS